jgi:hypothetical protein
MVGRRQAAVAWTQQQPCIPHAIRRPATLQKRNDKTIDTGLHGAMHNGNLLERTISSAKETIMAQAKAKSNSVVTTQWSGDILSISVLGGQLVGGQATDATLMFDRTRASEANRDQAERHGWTQRLCDRAAKGAPTRKPGDTDAAWEAAKQAVTFAKYQAIEVIIAYYESGDVPWKMSGGSEGGMLFEALCELYDGKKTVEQVRKFLDSRTDDQLKVLRKVPELVEIMNRLRVERSGAVDTASVLGDLDAMGDGEEPSVDEEISALMTDQ